MNFNIGKGGDVEVLLVLGESAKLEKGNELFSFLTVKVRLYYKIDHYGRVNV